MRLFTAGDAGSWEVTTLEPVLGPGLPPARCLELSRHLAPAGPDAGLVPGGPAAWVLRGTDSNLRYTTARERDALRAVSPALDRPEATCGALIPISMSNAWWELAQDERRAVLEEQSHHIAIGLAYLPAIARELSHGRDLGEPFDFLTWFEFTPEDAAAFEELVQRLRETPEWDYVEREVDIRLVRRA
jgi:hypothetical protein